MLGVYRINYTVIADDHCFTDHFFCKDMAEIKSSLVALFDDFNATSPYISDGCIYATGSEYDLMISVESTNIFDDRGLQALI